MAAHTSTTPQELASVRELSFHILFVTFMVVVRGGVGMHPLMTEFPADLLTLKLCGLNILLLRALCIQMHYHIPLPDKGSNFFWRA